MIKVIEGDCKDIFYPPNYFDTVITDPPYGLSFMGKDWDHGVPGIAFWKNFLFMCKPGAMMLVFGGTRTFHRLTCAIEDAGWQIRGCMMWLYGSGFPESLDISKAIDKAKEPRKKLAKQLSESGYGLVENDIKIVMQTAIKYAKLVQLWNGFGMQKYGAELCYC